MRPRAPQRRPGPGGDADRRFGGRREELHAHRTLMGVLIVLMGIAVVVGLVSPPERDPAGAAPPAPRWTRSSADEPMFTGKASWYGDYFAGRTAACGEPFDPEAFTVAHRWLPCGTDLLVSHGDRTVVVEVTDRGPYHGERALDLSRSAFRALAPLEKGVIQVQVRMLDLP